MTSRFYYARLGALAAVALIALIPLTFGPEAGATVLATSLTASEAQAPSLTVPDWDTNAAYLQVAGNGVSTQQVNLVLKQAIVADESSYAKYAEQWERSAGMPERQVTSRGAYIVTPHPYGHTFVSASSRLVSVLEGVVSEPPLGTHSAYWIAVTAAVPSGTRINLQIALFSNPTIGLKAVATSTESIVRSDSSPAYRCVAPGGRVQGGFEANPENYKYLALTTNGLAVGLVQGQVGAAACGPIEVTIPYHLLRGVLSYGGRSLISEVRNPVWQ